MQAGRMRNKLELLRPVYDVDGYGSDETSYVSVRTVWAERVKLSGNRSDEVDEHFPDYRAEFNIRYAHPVEENWRVRQLGGHLYTVTNIIPNIEKGMKTLVCDRVNE